MWTHSLSTKYLYWSYTCPYTKDGHPRSSLSLSLSLSFSLEEDALKKKMKPTTCLHICLSWQGSTGRSQPFLGNRGDTPRDSSGRPQLQRSESSGPGRERDRDRDTPRGRPQLKLARSSSHTSLKDKVDDGGWQTAGGAKSNRGQNTQQGGRSSSSSSSSSSSRPTLSVDIADPNSSPKLTDDNDDEEEDDDGSGSGDDDSDSDDGLLVSPKLL